VTAYIHQILGVRTEIFGVLFYQNTVNWEIENRLFCEKIEINDTKSFEIQFCSNKAHEL
jgi:hypothetical protein